MAFADLGTLGATGNSGNNQATLTLTTTANIAAGELVVVVVGDDNRTQIAGGGDDEAVSGVTIGGNAATKARQHTTDNLAAQAGASCSLWYWVSTTPVASGSNIVATFTNATTSDATAISARHFSFGAGNNIAVENTNALSNNAADPGSLDAATANIACLRVRGIAGEASAALGGLTVTSTWLDWDDGNSAATGTTLEIAVRVESIISTGTGAASDPTWGTCDNASVYVAFKELAPISGSTLFSAAAALATIAAIFKFRSSLYAAAGSFATTGTYIQGETAQVVGGGFGAYGELAYGDAVIPEAGVIAAATAFSASGALATAAAHIIPRTTAYSAAASVTTSGTTSIPRTTLFAAAGSLSTTATRTAHRSTAFAAVGSMAATGSVSGTFPRTTIFTATGSLSTSASHVIHRSTAFSASGTVAATVSHVIHRTIAVTAAGTLATSAAHILNRTTAFAGVGNMLSVGTAGGVAQRTTEFSAEGSVTTAAHQIRRRTTAFTGVASVTSSTTATRPRSTLFNGRGGMASLYVPFTPRRFATIGGVRRRFYNVRRPVQPTLKRPTQPYRRENVG